MPRDQISACEKRQGWSRMSVERARRSYWIVVFVLHDHFWWHPERCADEGTSFVDGIRQLFGDTEIGEFDIAVFGEKNVRGFDISMDLLLAMEIFQAFEHFAKNDADILFAEWTGFHQIQCWTSTEIFHHDPKLRSLTTAEMLSKDFERRSVTFKYEPKYFVMNGELHWERTWISCWMSSISSSAFSKSMILIATMFDDLILIPLYTSYKIRKRQLSPPWTDQQSLTMTHAEGSPTNVIQLSKDFFGIDFSLGWQTRRKTSPQIDRDDRYLLLNDVSDGTHWTRSEGNERYSSRSTSAYLLDWRFREVKKVNVVPHRHERTYLLFGVIVDFGLCALSKGTRKRNIQSESTPSFVRSFVLDCWYNFG